MGGDDSVYVFVFVMLVVDLYLLFVGHLFSFVFHVEGDCI